MVPVFYNESKAIRNALHTLLSFLARTDLERVFHGRKIFVPRAAGFETAWEEYDGKWSFRVNWPLVSLDELELLTDEDAEPNPSTPAHDPALGPRESIESEGPDTTWDGPGFLKRARETGLLRPVSRAAVGRERHWGRLEKCADDSCGWTRGSSYFESPRYIYNRGGCSWVRSLGLSNSVSFQTPAIF